MLVLIWLFIFTTTYIYFFRESFFAELAISFIPYIIAFCIIALVVETYLIINESYKRRKHKSIKIFFSILAIIFTIWIWTLYSSEFFSFYNHPDQSIRLTNQEWIKIFYANILYSNADFKSLQQKIELENPDIVILVEFSDAHEDEMKAFFKQNYPYMNRNSRSTMLAWDVVFSKIPIINLDPEPSQAWARNYSYMKLQCQDSISNCNNWIDLYVLHTAAPVSFKNFNMRNSQLNRFASDFKSQQKTWIPTIIIWDFNLSPWSHYYKELTQNWTMLNALSYQSPDYTRSLLQQWIFCSHIDQLFISPWIKISKINIEDLSGSDHRSFSFRFWF